MRFRDEADMSNPPGFNPMRWNCDAEGCYNVKQRPKIELFAECFPGKINFGDLDAAIVEINSRALLLEWKGAANQIPTGQHLTYCNLSKTGLLVAVVVAGNAETMAITHCGIYAGGQFTGWRNADISTVKDIFKRWAVRAKQLPSVPLRAALPKERISKLKIDEWVADYVAHQHEFDELLYRPRAVAAG